jgi:hypothetical protein
LVRARAEFFRGTGEVRSDEPTFDAWMDAFANWYLCDRPLSSAQTPVVRFLTEQSGSLTQEEVQHYQALTRTRRSVFHLLKLREGGMLVRDLFHGDKLEIIERRKPLGVQNGEVFDARLAPVMDGWWLMGAPLYHPADVRRMVARIVRSCRKKGVEHFGSVLHELAVRRLRVDRYKRVDAAELYRDMLPPRARQWLPW